MSRSDEVIDRLMAMHPGMRKAGFRKAVTALFPGDDFVDQQARGIVPDAYEVHGDLRTVTLIEVVESNPISPAKGEIIAALADALGDHDWQLTVAVFDYHGRLDGEFNGYFFAPFYCRPFHSPSAKEILPAVRRVLQEIERGEALEALGQVATADELADRLD